MGGYYISVNVKTPDAARVCESVAAIFVAEGFPKIADEAASTVVEDEDRLPPGDGWYGVMVSGVSGKGWVTVYVDDWKDSGLIARRLSAALTTPVLEVWVADDVHWGYTYYEQGEVVDRFADDPMLIAETNAEAAAYAGNAEALRPISHVPPAQFALALQDAHTNAGQFSGGPVDTLASAIGLPFEHLFTGYDYFFSDDPEDYSPDLENWPQFRHLAFSHPPGRETLET